jgi:predicted transcriptional regulator
VKRPRDLTDQQIAVLAVLWDRGEATANEIHQALAGESGWARGTVGTVLHRLERQRVLTHRAEGREFRYRALVSREDVMAARLDGLVGKLFGGDLAAMVSFAVSKADTRRGDVDKLRKMLESHRARKARP